MNSVRLMTVCGWLVCLWLAVVCVQGRTYDIKDGRHNITIGQRKGWPPYYTDYLIVRDSPSIPSSFWRVQSSDVCYPRPGIDTYRKFTITAANITDHMPPGQGGYAFVTEGGVNWGKLCLHLKTQRNCGYNFTVDIFGYYI